MDGGEGYIRRLEGLEGGDRLLRASSRMAGQCWHRRGRIRVMAGIVVVGLALCPGLVAAGGVRSEVEVKAAFLFHFSRYVQWPEARFETTTSPIVVGVLGDPEFYEVMVSTTREKRVDNRQLRIEKLGSSDDASRCHILFIGRSRKDSLAKIADDLRDTAVFAVSDAEGYVDLGGIVNFVMSDNKIRFEINDRVARESGLVVSSRLLRLATRLVE